MNHPVSKALHFYVAVDGDDRSSGRNPFPKGNDGPFATLTQARDAIRELKSKRDLEQPVVVAIRGGVYYLKDTMFFTPADSGTLECPVLYTTYRNEPVVISGGCKITGWTKTEEGLWSADVSALQRRGVQVRQLFVNGRRALRARLPLTGFFSVDRELVGSASELRFQFRDGDLKSQWGNGDTEIVIPQQWHAARHTVMSIDEDTRTLTAAGSPNWRVKHADYWLENCIGGLHVPGAWYWSRPLERIYYRPKGRENPNDADMIVPCLETLIRFDGDPAGQNTIRHISLSGFEFHHSAWDMGAEGYQDRQAASEIRAAVWADGTESCAVKRCRFLHLGNYALEWGRGCRNNEVRECEITDVGGGGIKIGDSKTQMWKDKRSISSDIVVADNHIHNIGLVYPGAVGVWIGQSSDNQVVHNHIHDTYYSGISVGWTWGYGLSNAHHNTIAFNKIHNIGREAMLNDMGAIYTLGVQPGTVIKHNLIHDVLSFKNGYSRHGIYLDEGSSFIVCENNVVNRTQSAGFVQHFGRENIIRNNIFALADESQIRLSKAEGHQSFRMERNIIYYRKLPMDGIGGASYCGMDYNMYWSRKPQNRRNYQYLNFWMAQRRFTGSLIAEAPRFDTVIVQPERSGVKSSSNPESRSFGAVPMLVFRNKFPDPKTWDSALILPDLVTCTGKPATSIRQAETECRILQDKTALFIKVHCCHSNLAFPALSGKTGQPELVDIYLKPDINRDRIIQFLVKSDGSNETYYHPAKEQFKTVSWDAKIDRTRTGWQTVLRIPLKNIMESCGGSTPAWGLFIARLAVLPPMTFSDWQETGADSHSLLADPLFANICKGDFKLRHNSPAFRLGFEPIDISTVGIKPRRELIIRKDKI